MTRLVKFLCVLLGALLLAAALAPAGAQELRLAGPAEPADDRATRRCETWDIPDTPARAWRTPEGRVALIAGAERSRRASGPDLDHLTRDCAILHEGAHVDDPAAYDDRAWIAAIRPEGEHLVALVHEEYHGNLRPDRCPAGEYMACWRNAITELRSTDGGRSFGPPPGGGRLVAALPYPYSAETGRREGYFSPSNILRRGDHLYAFVFAEHYRDQKRGACLIRRPLGGTAADWRAWDGTDFTRRFADPYREDVAEPAAHVCEPVPGLRSTLSGIVWHPETQRYIAVTPASPPDAGGTPRPGIYWTRSPDLIHWETPRRLLAAPLLWRRDCTQPAAYAYPSLIDPDSPSPALDEVDDSFWLYLVEIRLDAACRATPERRLIRRPVTLSGAADRP